MRLAFDAAEGKNADDDEFYAFSLSQRRFLRLLD